MNEFSHTLAAESSLATGWFKASRSRDALELVRVNPLAFILAYVIASRARWNSGFNQHCLSAGEAYLGDFRSYGMSAREYRTAREQLARWGFATFKTTNKGTIARLTDTRLFSVSYSQNDNQPDTQPTRSRHAADTQPTGNEERETLGAGEHKRETFKDSLASARATPKTRATVELMELCRQVLGKDELKRWHSRWLRRAESSPSLLQRVLNEVSHMKVNTSPAKAAEDLLKRWSKGKESLKTQ